MLYVCYDGNALFLAFEYFLLFLTSGGETHGVTRKEEKAARKRSVFIFAGAEVRFRGVIVCVPC